MMTVTFDRLRNGTQRNDNDGDDDVRPLNVADFRRSDSIHSNDDVPPVDEQSRYGNMFDKERLINGDDNDQNNNNQFVVHLDLFYAILKQVLDTTQQTTFFNILQQILQIDARRHVLADAGQDDYFYVWDLAEKLIRRAKLVQCKREADELLDFYGATTFKDEDRLSQKTNSMACHCMCHADSSTAAVVMAPKPPSPPPLPPPINDADSVPQSIAAPNIEASIISNRRPTFAEMISNAAASTTCSSTDTSLISVKPSSISKRPSSDSAQRTFSNAARSPPLPPPVSAASTRTDNGKNDGTDVKLPQQNLHQQPKTKLKTFAWSKVPASKVVDNVNNAENVWMKMASRFDDRQQTLYSAINFDDLEALFAAPTSPPNTIERNGARAKDPNGFGSSASLHSKDTSHFSNNGQWTTNGNEKCNGYGNGNYDGSTLGRRRDGAVEVNLLEPKRSLNVNIFLKQFRSGADDLIEVIENGDGRQLGVEKLRGLAKILPEMDEIETLKNFTGDKIKLGNAERFFRSLIEISHYRLRVESMLLKEEFLSIVTSMKPSIGIVIEAAETLKNSQTLQEVLFLVLIIGNYMNSGGYGGNAAGFKMTSLWKLVEIRANKPNVTLLHYVVAEIEKKNQRLLNLPNEMKVLEDASKLSVDTLISDFRHLKEKTDRISKQLAQIQDDSDVKRQTSSFLETAACELALIERDIDQVERLRLALAAFFCEDTQTFKLEDCFKIFGTFSQRFARAIEENAERRAQEEKAELRKRLKEQQKHKRDMDTLSLKSLTPEVESRRLSDKYSSLLNTSDVLLTYHVNVDAQSPDDLVSESKPHTNTAAMHDGLVGVLKRNSASFNVEEQSPIDDFSNGNPPSWRRSYNAKRRSSVTSTNRERPRDGLGQKTWRHRLDELMTENDQPNRVQSSGDLNVITILPRLDDDTQPSPVDKPQECSPIFAKTYVARRETARIASTTDLRNQNRSQNSTISRPNHLAASSSSSIENTVSTENLGQNNTENQDFDQPPAAMGVKRSVWREQRRSKAISLFADTPEDTSCANDLNELLETLENEKTVNFRQKKFDQRAPVSKAISDTTQAHVSASSDIDDVVRECERVRDEIDNFCIDSTMVQSQTCIIARDETSMIEECTVDFAISAEKSHEVQQIHSINTPEIDYISSDSLATQSTSSPESEKATSLIILHPNEIMADEGFDDAGSNSTHCESMDRSVLFSPPAAATPTKKIEKEKEEKTGKVSLNKKSINSPSKMQSKCLTTSSSQTKFSYQSGTKSSTLKTAPSAQIVPTQSAVNRPKSIVSQSSQTLKTPAKTVNAPVKTTPISGSVQNSRLATGPKTSSARQQIPASAVQKPLPKPNSPAPAKTTPASKTMAVLKNRLQNAKLTPSIFAQKNRTGSIVNDTSSSSSSDTEKPAEKRISFLRRKQAAPVRAAVPATAPVQNAKTTPTCVSTPKAGRSLIKRQ